MTRKIALLFVVFFISLSCGNQANSKEQSDNEKNMAEAPVPREVMDKGEEIYRKHCMACHQADGSGNPGMFPPLSETKTVNGDKEKLINIILNGQEGKIEVKGEIYNQVMVPHSFLTDKEIASVLTYVRKSFGNNSTRINPEEVAKLRTK